MPKSKLNQYKIRQFRIANTNIFKTGFTLKRELINIKAKSAFTLIELLIVILIISILSALITSQLNIATKKARDSKRKADVDLIRVAFQHISQDQLGGTLFPECNTGQGNNGCTLQNGTETNPKLSDSLPKIPNDPLTNIGYQYYPKPSGPSQCNNTSQNKCTKYTMVACIENSKDTSAIADSSECPTTGYKYVIDNY